MCPLSKNVLDFPVECFPSYSDLHIENLFGTLYSYYTFVIPVSDIHFYVFQLAGVQDNNMWKQFDELHQFCVSCGVTLLINADVPLQQPNKLTTFVHNLACMNYMEVSSSFCSRDVTEV